MNFPEVAHGLRFWLRQHNLDPDQYTIEIRSKTGDGMYNLRSQLARETQQVLGGPMNIWDPNEPPHTFLTTGDFRMMGLDFKITTAERELSS